MPVACKSGLNIESEMGAVELELYITEMLLSKQVDFNHKYL